jgi:hypothetical protein
MFERSGTPYWPPCHSPAASGAELKSDQSYDASVQFAASFFRSSRRPASAICGTQGSSRVIRSYWASVSVPLSMPLASSSVYGTESMVTSM